jgi:probable selenium-dependent hydroxylase accessory protein YqeC
MTEGLVSALCLGDREHIALVGGGGKTSLMFALARELRSQGRRVVTGTTTKILYREVQSCPCVILPASGTRWHEKMRDALETHGLVFIDQGVLGSGKVEGIHPDVADLIYRDPKVDFLIIEADGSAGRPVKAPAAHEPVIPRSATTVIAVMGLEALGKSLVPEVVFRLELFEEMTGLKSGDPLTLHALAMPFQAPSGLFKGVPPTARRAVFLNKLDLLHDQKEAMELADMLLHASATLVDMVVMGSITMGSYQRIGQNA